MYIHIFIQARDRPFVPATPSAVFADFGKEELP
jgi:hypothetical protein